MFPRSLISRQRFAAAKSVCDDILNTGDVDVGAGDVGKRHAVNFCDLVEIVGASGVTLAVECCCGDAVGADEEVAGDAVVGKLRNEVALHEVDRPGLCEGGAAEAIATKTASEVLGPCFSVVEDLSGDEVHGDVAPSVTRGVDENQEVGGRGLGDFEGLVCDGLLSPLVEVRDDRGRDRSGRVPEQVASLLHVLSHAGDEAHEVEETEDLEVDDLHGVEEESDVGGETTPRPTLAERPGKVELVDDLAGEADGLVGHVEVDAAPIAFCSGERGEIGGVVDIVDGDADFLAATVEGLSVRDDGFLGASEEDVVDVVILNLRELREGQNVLCRGDGGEDHVGLTGGSDTETVESGSWAGGRGAAEDEEVADFFGDRVLRVEGGEVEVDHVIAGPNVFAAACDGEEGDFRSRFNILVDVFGVLNDAEALLGDFGDEEDVDDAFDGGGVGDDFDGAVVDELFDVVDREGSGHRGVLGCLAGNSMVRLSVHQVLAADDDVGEGCGGAWESEKFSEVDAEEQSLGVDAPRRTVDGSGGEDGGGGGGASDDVGGAWLEGECFGEVVGGGGSVGGATSSCA